MTADHIWQLACLLFVWLITAVTIVMILERVNVL